LYIKQLSQGGTLPLGYSNGMVGYVPTAAQIAEGGYEGDSSSVSFGLPAPLRRRSKNAFVPRLNN
jgi:hypothetical protein